MAPPSPAPVLPTPAMDEDGALMASRQSVLPSQPAAALTGSGDSGGGRGRHDSGQESPLQGYLAAVRMGVDAAKRYPRIAEQQRHQGRVLVIFSLSTTGELLREPEVVPSSGCRHLDRAALRAVRRSAPYSKFPGKSEDLPAALQVETSFVLRQLRTQRNPHDFGLKWFGLFV